MIVSLEIDMNDVEILANDKHKVCEYFKSELVEIYTIIKANLKIAMEDLKRTL